METAGRILADVPRSFPAVLEAYQLTRQASRIGFDWSDLSGILDKLDEEKRELQSLVAANRASSGRVGQQSSSRIEEEVGDLLFAGVNIARFLGIDPEIALKKANRKFGSGSITWRRLRLPKGVSSRNCLASARKKCGIGRRRPNKRRVQDEENGQRLVNT